MKQVIKRYWADSFWRNNIIFFSFSLCIAGLNYLYYPVLGRMMDIRHFGEVQTILSMMNIIGMLLGAIQIVIVNISANQTDKDTASQQIIHQFERFSIRLVILLAVLVGAGAPLLRSFFAFESTWPFVLLGLALVVSVPAGFRGAYLQGKQRFGLVSAAGLLLSGGKLLFSVGFVLMGWGTHGAIGGLLAATVVGFAFTARYARLLGYGKRAAAHGSFHLLKPQLRYLASVMAVSTILTLLLSGDILVVKRYFSPEIAGQYAGVSAVAKIIFFAITPLSQVLLASVGPSRSPRHNIVTGRKSMVLATAIGGSLLVLFTLASSTLIGLLMGGRYAGYAHLLPYISAATFLASIGYMSMYYLLALRVYAAPFLAVGAGLTTFLLVLLRHDTLEAVVGNFAIGSTLLILLIGVMGVYKYKKFAGAGAI